MPLGRYLTAPIFVFNLAGEMIYILNQRLKAQNIPQDKGKLFVEFSYESTHRHWWSYLQVRVRVGTHEKPEPSSNQLPEVPSSLKKGPLPPASAYLHHEAQLNVHGQAIRSHANVL